MLRAIPAFGLTLLLAVVLVLAAMLSTAVPVQAETSGPRWPGSGTNVNGPGTRAWNDPAHPPQNITIDDGSFAQVELRNYLYETSEYLRGTNYGFSICPDADIDGITVTVSRAAGDGNRARDEDVYLLQAGTHHGSDYAKSANWSQGWTVVTYGGPTDKWGTTWTPADINNANFGVDFSVHNTSYWGVFAGVEYMQITVHYTLPSTTASVSASPTSPSTYGDNVTFTATITGSHGSSTPSGSVYFIDGGTAIGSGTLSGSGLTATATFSTTSLAAGSHSMTVIYGGDDNFQGSISSPLVYTVNARAITVTADPQGKDYGDADPGLTYTWAPSLIGGDSFSGALSREAGENVGSYAINQGTLSLSSNYTIVYVGANLTISPLAITVTANAQSKTYGSADPGLTYTWAPALIGGDSFSGSLGRAAGEDVGAYAINQGTLTAGANYTITYVGANLTISPLAITVTADAQGKDYGDADPPLTYTWTPSLVGGDSFSGALSRVAGENVGSYAINQGTLSLSSNYTITYVGANLTVGPLAITVTADAQGKTYGSADPGLTYTWAPALIGGDSFSGSLSRAAGEDVGAYAINQGTLSLSSNYNLTYVGADLTISPLAITVTADAQGKTYGEADPALTYTWAPSLIGGDSFSGSLSRAAGENAGSYAINQGTLSLSSNYTIIYVGANLTISPLAITVTADAKSKVYGDADPGLTYAWAPTLIGGDSFSGYLGRAAGEDVGDYAINQGTLSLSANYTITFIGANLTISPLAITVTADAQGRDYGDSDPALTYTCTPSLIGGDSFSGSLSRAAGEDVGAYAINQGTLSLSSNYTIIYVGANLTYVGANLTISPLAITVTADAQGKTYGSADPALTYTWTPSLVGGDSFTGSLSRVAGENVGSYAINQGTLSLSSNYTIIYVGADLTISPLAITVTADAQGKTYGSADPALTYTWTPSLVGGDSFTGSLSRVAGENVGSYAINQGTLSLSSNYTIIYVGADLTISPLAITVTADAKGKTYGDADPALTYTWTPSLVGSDSFSGALSRDAGENVGSYAINQGTLTAGANYTITLIGANLTISPLDITVTADAQGKTYGSADPALTYSWAPALIGGDSFSGSLSRAAGENVDSYAINQGTLSLSSNYTIAYVGANLTITPLAITVTADAQSKVYGAADPALTYTWTPSLIGGDSFSGSLSRAAGEDVGAYAIKQGTLSLSANYTITYVGANLTISPLAITVTADAQGKAYGDDDPALTYSWAPSLIGGDSFSGSLSRVTGEDAGSYAINQGTLSLSANYTITYVGADLTITPLAITVTADAQGKTYGNDDPALTYTWAPSLIGGDSFSGSLSRVAGENVGSFAINQGTLTAGANYAITFIGSNLTISPLAITVTADAQGKDYGEADPALTYSWAPALVAGDSFSGSLSRMAGENVGSFAINQGTLSLSSNYTITYVGANLAISPLTITVTADAQGKTYGDADPALTYTWTPSLVGSDSFSGALSRDAGEDVGAYAINQGTLTLSANYTITYVGASLTISPLAITVTADAQGKTYGDADPALTYTWTPSLVGSDSFSGALSRDAGENTGSYAINQGTLTLSSNYTITYVGANLIISPLAITVTADAQGKTYGDADPALTYTWTPSLVGSDSFSGALSRDAGENAGTYAINQGTLTAGSNYIITFVPDNFAITPLNISVTADAKIKVYGDPDPPLTYTCTPSLIGSDSFSGALSRDAGEDIGIYAINQGTLSLSSNYTLTYAGANLTICPPVLTITSTSPLPGATVGVAYSQNLTASGGTAPYAWSIDSGTLPEGLAFGADGTIFGTPTTAGGPVTITFRVTDSVFGFATADLSITIAKGTPTITWANPDDIVYGTALDGTQLDAAASVPGSFVYTPASGTLLNAGNGQTLHVDFTPTDTANYNTASADVTINVNPLGITITADARSKTYGEADPALSYTNTPSLIGGDSFSGALSRDPGEGVGFYTISQGTLAAGPNYTITYAGANLTISALAITVTADAQGKYYGDADPALTYTCTPSLVGSDVFSGSLTRDPGEDANTYAISQGTLTAGANYTITFTGANLTISPLAITVTADAQGKAYGAADPALAYDCTPSLIGGDTFSGALSRDPGEAVGSYAINQGTLTAGGNYTITFIPDNFTITPLNISVTADAKIKVYGDADPALSYTFTPSLIGSDTFSGELSRDPGEDIGVYAINQGTLALSGNYTITFTGATLTIAPPVLTITTISPLPGGTVDVPYSQTLIAAGGTAPYTWSIDSGTLPDGLTLNPTTGEISGTPTTAGGPVTITFMVTDDVASTDTADISIMVAKGTPTITWADPAGITYGTALDGTQLNAIASVPGTFVYTPAAGTLLNAGDGQTLHVDFAPTDAANYNTASAGVTVDVAPLDITVTVDARSKTYGDAEPALTYAYSPSLVGGDSFSGSLSRAAGENVGTYAIAQGTLSLPSNYAITCMGADLTISPLGITVTADARGKTYGDADPALTYSYSPSLIGGDSFGGSLSRAAGEDVGTYPISQGTLTAGSNYSISYISASLTVGPRALTITADDLGKAFGDTLTFAGTEFVATGLVYSDAVDSVTLTSAGADAAAAIGDYEIFASAAAGTGLGNYSIAYASGTLAVRPTLTITANNATKTYGDAATFAGTEFTVIGLQGGDSVDNVTLASSGASASATVGAYAIVPGGAAGTGLANYHITYIGGWLTISPRALTVTANSLSKTYGDGAAFAGNEFTASGLVNSDTVTGLSLTSTGAAASATVGSYSLVPSGATGSGLGNYSISYVNGMLTVAPRNMTITAGSMAKVYGEAVSFSGTEYMAAGLVNSDTVTGLSLTSTGAAASATVGSYSLVPSGATGSGLDNYSISYVNGALTVGPRPLAITAKNRVKSHGSAVTFAGTEFVTMGLVNSDAVTSVALESAGAGQSAAAGTYDIVPGNAAGNGLGNYVITYFNGTLRVDKAGVIWTVTSAPASSAHGSPVTLTAMVNNTEATGTVTFMDGGAVLGTAGLSHGMATFTISELTPGSHYITVGYGGDSNFSDGRSLAHIHTVKAAEGFNWWWIIICGLAAGGFFFLLVLYRRRRKEQKEAV